MAEQKPALGAIDCPHCGQVGGMTIRHDKNVEPFGHCEDCGGQLRVGGRPARVRKFLARYPWAAAPGEKPAAAPGEKPAPAPVTETKEQPAPAVRRKPSFMDGLKALGVEVANHG